MSDSKSVEVPQFNERAPQQQAQAAPPGQPPLVPDNWRQEFDAVVSQRDSFKAQARDAAAKVSAYEAEKASHEAEKAARRQAEETKKLAEAGQYQEIIQKNEQKWQQALADREKAYSSAILPLYITAASTSIPNMTPEARRDLPILLQRHVRTGPDGSAQVLEEDGRQKLDDMGRPYDPVRFISEFVQSRPYMLVDQMPRAHGAAQANGMAQGAKSPIQGGKRDMAEMMADKDNAGLEKWRDEDPDGFRAAHAEWTKSLGTTSAARARFGKK